jgi:hypothetical protein
LRPSAIGATLGWLLRATLLFPCAAFAGYAVVWLLGAAGLWGDEPINTGDYLYVVILALIAWPFYLVLIAYASRQHGDFRRAALLMAPVMGLPLIFGIFLIWVPEILAGWLFWLSYGALVPRPPGAPRPVPASR